MKLSVDGSVARLATEDREGSRVFIVENNALERLLFDRNLIGVVFRDACLDASRLFVRHIADDIGYTNSMSELVVLSKGLLYQLGVAVSDETGTGLPLNLVATTRIDVSSEDATIDIRMSHSTAVAQAC